MATHTASLSYVYSLAAARARFRRGDKVVYLFWPNSGCLVEVTPSNIRRVQQAWNNSFK